jgi:hypothetical protein
MPMAPAVEPVNVEIHNADNKVDNELSILKDIDQISIDSDISVHDSAVYMSSFSADVVEPTQLKINNSAIPSSSGYWSKILPRWFKL